MNASAYTLTVSATHDQFVTEAVTLLKTWILDAIGARGKCVIALSGASTPRPIYEALAQEQGIDWSKVTLCLADERYVGADSKDSNQKMIRETFLAHDAAGATTLFPDTTLPLHACVDDYESKMLTCLGAAPFDIVTLGMGNDGHTTSLFPPVTDEGLTRMGCVHTTTDRFDVRDRISLTLPLLQAAQKRILLLTGEEKKCTWEEMTAAQVDAKRWPLQQLLDEHTVVVAQW